VLNACAEAALSYSEFREALCIGYLHRPLASKVVLDRWEGSFVLILSVWDACNSGNVCKKDCALLAHIHTKSRTHTRTHKHTQTHVQMHTLTNTHPRTHINTHTHKHKNRYKLTHTYIL